jgi:uncharacterized protein YodC (DUF2158 family)
MSEHHSGDDDMDYDAKFKVGDVVRLNSGGPHMTVEAVDGGEFTVSWFDGGKARTCMFFGDMLELAPCEGKEDCQPEGAKWDGPTPDIAGHLHAIRERTKQDCIGKGLKVGDRVRCRTNLAEGVVFGFTQSRAHGELVWFVDDDGEKAFWGTANNLDLLCCGIAADPGDCVPAWPDKIYGPDDVRPVVVPGEAAPFVVDRAAPPHPGSEAQFKPGDRVRRRNDGATGRVEEVNDDGVVAVRWDGVDGVYCCLPRVLELIRYSCDAR